MRQKRSAGQHDAEDGDREVCRTSHADHDDFAGLKAIVEKPIGQALASRHSADRLRTVSAVTTAGSCGPCSRWAA